jgi:hypothetical protein
MSDLEAKFGDEMKNKRVCKTPGMPGFNIVHPENDEGIMKPNLQSQY